MANNRLFKKKSLLKNNNDAKLIVLNLHEPIASNSHPLSSSLQHFIPSFQALRHHILVWLDLKRNNYLKKTRRKHYETISPDNKWNVPKILLCEAVYYRLLIIILQPPSDFFKYFHSPEVVGRGGVDKSETNGWKWDKLTKVRHVDESETSG